MNVIAAVISALAWPALAQPCEPPYPVHNSLSRDVMAYACPAADLDADGDLDVLLPAFDVPAGWAENLGGHPPQFEFHPVGGAQGDYAMMPGDLDGDGDLDVASAPFHTSDLWHENLGGSPPVFRTHEAPDTEDGSIVCELADLDGDGDLDIVQTPDALVWYVNDGGSPPGFEIRTISDQIERPFWVAASDLDLDGDTDLAVVHFAPDLFGWYQNDGNNPPSFTWRLITDAYPAVGQVVAADMDDDGDPDLLTTLSEAGAVWFENLGGSPPAFAERPISGPNAGAIVVTPLDFDRDGRLDAALSQAGDPDELWLYRNAGGDPPVFEPCKLAEQDRGYLVLEPADLDGDGDPDLIARRGGFIHWYENPRCIADFDEDGVVDTRDFLAFLNAWNSDDPGADINGDGAFDTLDVLAFLNLWVERC